MARLRTNVLKWGNKYDGPNTYKMGREGALDDALWPEDELVDYPKSSKKKRKPKAKRGCPENDFGPHVYVWVNYEYRYSWTDKVFIYYSKVCCGCDKVAKRKYTRVV